MHYYKKNVGDYAKKAGRLSLLQHGVYNLLIDACYDRETFPTAEQAAEWVWASTSEEIEAVNFVLRRFFTLVDGVYVQSRIQEEIDLYREKANKNKQIAIERETKRARSVHETYTDGHLTNNHKPLTNNHKPIKEIRATTRPTVEEVAEYVSTRDTKIDPQHFVDYYTANGWKVGKNVMKDWRATVRTWERRENENTKRPVNGNPDTRRLSPGDRTRELREQRRREQSASRSSDMGCLDIDA